MIRALNDEEQQRMLAACEDAVDRALLVGLLDTGMRVEEWCSVDGEAAIAAARTGAFAVRGRLTPTSRRLTALLAQRYAGEPVGSRLPLRPRTAAHRLRQVARRAGLPTFTPAWLRLTFVRNALLSGVTEASVRAALGSWPASARRVALEVKRDGAGVVGEFKHAGW